MTTKAQLELADSSNSDISELEAIASASALSNGICRIPKNLQKKLQKLPELQTVTALKKVLDSKDFELNPNETTSFEKSIRSLLGLESRLSIHYYIEFPKAVSTLLDCCVITKNNSWHI